MSNSITKWEYVWKKPFIADVPYIKSGNNKLALSLIRCIDGLDADSTLGLICEILNGNRHGDFDDVRYESCQIFINGHLTLMVLGWGYLTGISALNLNREFAAKLQDDFGQWVVERLKRRNI